MYVRTLISIVIDTFAIHKISLAVGCLTTLECPLQLPLPRPLKPLPVLKSLSLRLAASSGLPPLPLTCPSLTRLEESSPGSPSRASCTSAPRPAAARSTSVSRLVSF